MNKVFITVEGETATLETAALITWALMKLGIRPSYEGDNKTDWQWLASDEFQLEQKLRLIATNHQFLLSERTTKVEAIALPVATIEEMAKKGQE